MPRPLNDDERALLEHLLKVDMPGVEELRGQIDYVEVVDDSTIPGNIELHVPDEAPPARKVLAQVPIRAVSRDDAPEEADVTLWMDGYYLGAIEISWWTREPTRLPRPDEMEPAYRLMS